VKRRALWVTSLMITSTLAIRAYAQEPSDKAKRMQEERAAFARALKDGIAKIEFLRGPWQAALLKPKGTDWVAAGNVRIELEDAAGGKALTTTISLNGYTYLMFFTYDALQKAYRVTSLDDVSGLMDVYEGNFDDAGALAVSNTGPGTSYASLGTTYHNRMRFLPTGTRSWELQVDFTIDNGATWRPQLRGVVKPASATIDQP
jgi:hypothetical protein